LALNSPSVQGQWTAAFVQRLGELGWMEGRNVAIEYRWAETRFDRSPGFIAEFVRLKVDVIVTHATANVAAAKQGTSIIPIVFAALADPVGTGVVESLAHPGGNLTGLSNLFIERTVIGRAPGSQHNYTAWAAAKARQKLSEGRGKKGFPKSGNLKADTVLHVDRQLPEIAGVSKAAGAANRIALGRGSGRAEWRMGGARWGSLTRRLPVRF
jgi:hypothetical protein